MPLSFLKRKPREQNIYVNPHAAKLRIFSEDARDFASISHIHISRVLWDPKHETKTPLLDDEFEGWTTVRRLEGETLHEMWKRLSDRKNSYLCKRKTRPNEFGILVWGPFGCQYDSRSGMFFSEIQLMMSRTHFIRAQQEKLVPELRVSIYTRKKRSFLCLGKKGVDFRFEPQF